MTTPDLEAGLSSYPPALLAGSANPNRMRARLPAGEEAAGPVTGGASPLPGGAETGEGVELVETGSALSPGAVSVPTVDGPVTAEGVLPLLVDAGAPGTYSPSVTAGQRPRNVSELTERGRPNGRAPWDAGQYVLVGISGKRAHWTGDRWAGGESPGYTPADTAFPGDGDDTAEDQTR